MIRRLLDIDAAESTACAQDATVSFDGGVLIIRGYHETAELRVCGRREALLLASRIARVTEDGVLKLELRQVRATTAGDEGGEAIRAAEARGDGDRAALLRFANLVLNTTKHGDARGEGPCRPRCAKCEASRILNGGA